jgi:hypothetical protein
MQRCYCGKIAVNKSGYCSYHFGEALTTPISVYIKLLLQLVLPADVKRIIFMYLISCNHGCGTPVRVCCIHMLGAGMSNGPIIPYREVLCSMCNKLKIYCEIKLNTDSNSRKHKQCLSDTKSTKSSMV